MPSHPIPPTHPTSPQEMTRLVGEEGTERVGPHLRVEVAVARADALVAQGEEARDDRVKVGIQGTRVVVVLDLEFPGADDAKMGGRVAVGGR